MLCLPGDIPLAIEKIKAAIAENKLSWAAIETHCKKVLEAKYQYGLTRIIPINTDNLTNDLNSKIKSMRRLIAENALTLLKKTDAVFFPLAIPAKPAADIAYVSIGNNNTDSAFAARMRTEYNAAVFNFDFKQDSLRAIALLDSVKQFKKIIIGVHGFNRPPLNNFGISKAAVDLTSAIQQQTTAFTFVFGNPYAVKNWCGAKNLIVCYEDDEIIQNTALDMLQGKIRAQGTLPVTVCEDFHYGSGIVSTPFFLPKADANNSGFDPVKLYAIDSIANDAIAKGATPGAVVLVAKDGKIVYHKAFGNYTYDKSAPVITESVFDMASVTKVCATTISIMKLYDEGKIDLKKKLGDYLPWVKGSNKENLLIENILLHQAGLVSYIPFYKETIDSSGNPLPKYYRSSPSDSFSIRVAQNLFMRNSWRDTMYKRILQSQLGAANKYVYSDNDFIFLGKVVEAVSGLPLDEYAKKEFYTPLGLTATGFKPGERFPLSRIIPTEKEKAFRQQLLLGDVHDPGAAMFGGVSGHAGLFSTSYDLAVIMQMLLNGGNFNGKKYLNSETVKLFTTYHSDISRRGYGFDKPEKDNAKLPEPYPCLSASPLTFGHTGYTGTCVWSDPEQQLTFIFLSNRVNPDGGDINKKLLNMNVRPKIMEAIYKAMIK
jgi:CubicO group peptidase (beta-lactamase class C family)